MALHILNIDFFEGPISHMKNGNHLAYGVPKKEHTLGQFDIQVRSTKEGFMGSTNLGVQGGYCGHHCTPLCKILTFAIHFSRGLEGEKYLQCGSYGHC